MNRRLLLLAAAMLATPVHAAVDWASLWRNADQRGEQLLRSGDAAAAGRTYSDPRRRAYAEAQVGNHDAAARDLSAFDDSDSHYNRGNALARSGKLEEALKAYDSALERNPDDQDARHNRDLVAQAMQQRKPQDQQPSGKGQSGDHNNGNDGSGKDQQNGGGNQDGNQPQQSSQSGSSGGNAGQSKQDPSSQQQRDQQGADAGSQEPTNGSSSNKGQEQKQSAKQGSQPQSGNHARGAQAQASGQDDKNPSKPQDAEGSLQAPAAPGDEKQQARQDAAAGLKDADPNAKRNAANATAVQQGGKPGGDVVNTGPVSEQKLAEDQWLRRIPDDPGGLLRRKFMIEHMLKQQQDSQNNPP